MQTEGVPRPVNAAGFVAGDLVGSWRIEGELGRGGMSTVYAVVHAEIGKRAALKVVHGHVLSSTFTAERVLLEAQVVNRIAHAHIVDIFESGTLSDGRPYLVMERLDGVTLGERFADSRLPAPEVISTLIQICDALAAAHAAGVVHRDLKLDNVFLVDGASGPRTWAKVLDWGIAKVVTDSPRNTFADKLIGTPQYVSPEQARGGEITPAADIYSLGVMAYELFLETPPFVSQSAAELLVMHLRDDPPPPRDFWPEIPPRLEALLLAMLDKTAGARPSATEVAYELAAIRDTLPQRVLDAPPMLAPAVRISSRREVQVVPLAIAPTLAPQRTVPPTIIPHVRRPRLQRQRVLVGAIAAVALLAGIGTTEALLRADDALGVESLTTESAAAAAPAPTPAAKPRPAATTPAPARTSAPTPSTMPAAVPAAPSTDPLSSDPRPDPDRRPGSRRHHPRPVRQFSPRTLASTAGALDPDGTIEPYQ